MRKDVRMPWEGIARGQLSLFDFEVPVCNMQIFECEECPVAGWCEKVNGGDS